MNKKIKTVLTIGIGFLGGVYALTAAELSLCDKGRMYIFLKETKQEYGNRRIVPPSSGRYHWNSDSEEEKETSE